MTLFRAMQAHEQEDLEVGTASVNLVQDSVENVVVMVVRVNDSSMVGLVLGTVAFKTMKTLSFMTELMSKNSRVYTFTSCPRLLGPVVPGMSLLGDPSWNSLTEWEVTLFFSLLM